MHNNCKKTFSLSIVWIIECVADAKTTEIACPPPFVDKVFKKSFVESVGNDHLVLQICRARWATWTLDGQWEIHMVRKFRRKHFRTESLMICFPWWSDKVMIVLHYNWVPTVWFFFQHRQQCCAHSTDRKPSEVNGLLQSAPCLYSGLTFVSSHVMSSNMLLCPCVSDNLKKSWNTKLLPLSAV
jgi:hypothetical protein